MSAVPNRGEERRGEGNKGGSNQKKHLKQKRFPLGNGRARDRESGA